MRLHRADVPQRDIAEMMDCSLGSVQHVLRRERMRRPAAAASAASATDELPDELESTSTYGLDADELAELERAMCIAELAADPGNELARHRMRHLPW